MCGNQRDTEFSRLAALKVTFSKIKAVKSVFRRSLGESLYHISGLYLYIHVRRAAGWGHS